ncbi:MAG: hypothetical protein PHV17_06575 [Candidatus Omnitrophica bacterium]|nr:hypothetical protein [Candidatus Omnitrophota bacterium]
MTSKTIDLSEVSEETLLKTKICNLPLKIEGTWLENCVEELYQNLQDKGINFKPPCYLADEWLTPDKEPIIGIPFFLANPVLIKLEKKMIIEAEGSTKPWCMKLLRHEAGHAINYAYRLFRKKKWQKIFGKFTQEYADTYKFRPYSKSYVRHLEDYYAQYHPDEDFAETFAVWLTPDSQWQTKYKGWKALEKLNYVEELMRDVGNKVPLVSKGEKYWHLLSLRMTLASYYKKKQYSYAEALPDFHDSNLKRIFSKKEDVQGSYPMAATLIKACKKDMVQNVSMWTGEKKFIIDSLMKKIMLRCRQLQLVVVDSQDKALLKITAYVTTLIMNYSHTGGFSH